MDGKMIPRLTQKISSKNSTKSSYENDHEKKVNCCYTRTCVRVRVYMRMRVCTCVYIHLHVHVRFIYGSQLMASRLSLARMLTT